MCEVGRGEKDSHWWCRRGSGLTYERVKSELEHGDAAKSRAGFGAEGRGCEKGAKKKAAWLHLDSGGEATTGCRTTEEDEIAEDRKKRRIAGKATRREGEGSHRRWRKLVHAKLWTGLNSSIKVWREVDSPIRVVAHLCEEERQSRKLGVLLSRERGGVLLGSVREERAKLCRRKEITGLRIFLSFLGV